ncbi:hypothetical protein Dip510_000886 [Elusimicrobium posterum]|uniref:hypothetical protein n=1 Tax=Elusimicrobium posterum TaxID=3116653 RepID=UPI003C796A37
MTEEQKSKILVWLMPAVIVLPLLARCAAPVYKAHKNEKATAALREAYAQTQRDALFEGFEDAVYVNIEIQNPGLRVGNDVTVDLGPGGRFSGRVDSIAHFPDGRKEVKVIMERADAAAFEQSLATGENEVSVYTMEQYIEALREFIYSGSEN